MVLQRYKHLIFTKKSILIGLLSLCVIVTGCDKKSERRRQGKQAVGGKDRDTKTDPNQAQQGDQPCITPQAGALVPAGQNNNPGVNTQNSHVAAATVDPNAPKVATPPNTTNGKVPCVPGQQPQRPGVPGANINGSTSAKEDSVDTHNPVLVGSESNEKNNNSGSNAQNSKETDGKGSQSNPHALPNLDLKGSAAHASDDEDSSDQRSGDEDDDEENVEDDKNVKLKYTKDVKQLLMILKELDNFYKNAMWTITRDKYNTPKNFFEILRNRLQKGVKNKSLLVKIDGKYIEESRDHSCSDSALELQTNTDKELQKLFVYNCDREMIDDENSPVLVFRKNSKGWSLATSIQGLGQIIDDKNLGFLITIPNNENVSRIVMRPKCEIVLADEDQKSIKIQSASCKYWGQQFTTRDNKNETYLFEEFNYDANKVQLFSVKARSLDLDNESNQLCYKNQIDVLAKKSAREIDITDGHDDKGVACSTTNKDLTKNGNKLGQPQTQNLAVAQQQNNGNQSNTNTESQIIPQTLHFAQSQQEANPLKQANQLSPMDQASPANQPDEKPQSEVVNYFPDDADDVPVEEEDEQHALNDNAPQTTDSYGDQNMTAGEPGVEGTDATTVDGNSNLQQAPPVVYRQPRGRQQLGNQQNTENVVPPVHENYHEYEGQQMDFSSEVPSQESH